MATFWDRIFRRHGLSNIEQLFVQNYENTAVWPSTAEQDTFTDSYTGNGDVFTVINKIIEPASRVPILHVDKDGEEKAISRTMDLISAPSPFMTLSDLIEQALGYYLIYGNMYLNALKPDGGLNMGKPVRLEFLPPPFTSIKVGGRLEPITGYEMEYAGSTLSFNVADVMHWKEFNPDWGDNFGVYGMSRLKPLIKSITASDSAYQSMVSAFQNQGATGILTVLGVKDSDGKLGQRSTSKQQLAALKNQFRPGGEHVGDKARSKIIATAKSVEWVPIGMSPVDMQILQSLGVSRGSIADAYNVPNQLLSGSQDKTYNNYQEAARSLWTNAIQPNLDALLMRLSNWLLPQMGEDGKLVADYSGVDVLQKNKKELVEWMVRASAFTRNEIREATGYDMLPVQEMDHVYIPFGEVPIDDQMPTMDETEKILRNDYRTQ